MIMADVDKRQEAHFNIVRGGGSEAPDTISFRESRILPLRSTKHQRTKKMLR